MRTTYGTPGNPSARRGMLPFSGLLIIVGVLMLGSALAIPASRAMQEAEMRDRVAAFSSSSDSSQSTAPSTSDDNDQSSSAQLPAIAEQDEDDEDSEGSALQPDDVETSRGSDIASSVDALRSTDGESNVIETEPVEMPAPKHLRIPGVGIDTEIVEVGYEIIELEGQRVREWEVASYAAGHHKTSANPGEGRNIVITGHNDWEGEVFRTLEKVEEGYEVIIRTEEGEHTYVVEEIHLRREVGVSMDERLATGAFMADMPEERVTLITCWPYGINDHRVIVVAKPVEE